MSHRRSSQGHVKQAEHKRERFKVAPKSLSSLIAADRWRAAPWKKGTASHEHPMKRNCRRSGSFGNSSSGGHSRGKTVPRAPLDSPWLCGDPRGKMVPMTPPDPPPLCIDPRGTMVPRTPPDPLEPNRLGSPPLRSVLKRCFQEAATAQSSSSSSSTQQVRFQCPSPPVEVRSYKKIMKDHLQFDGVTVCDGRYCRHSFLAGAGEGLFPWDENGELLGNLNRYEIFCDECQRDMEEKLCLFLNTYAT